MKKVSYMRKVKKDIEIKTFQNLQKKIFHNQKWMKLKNNKLKIEEKNFSKLKLKKNPR